MRADPGYVGFASLCVLSLFRLKTRLQFQAVLAGKTLARTAHFALHCCELDDLSSDTANAPLFPARGVWVGAMVPKRWAKRAVTRNAIKRQIYAVSAELRDQFSEKAHVVRLRSSFSRSDFASASSDVLKCAVRTELIKLLGRERGQALSNPVPVPVAS